MVNRKPERSEEPHEPEEPEEPECPEDPEAPEEPETPEDPEERETTDDPENAEEPETPEQLENTRFLQLGQQSKSHQAGMPGSFSSVNSRRAIRLECQVPSDRSTVGRDARLLLTR